MNVLLDFNGIAVFIQIAQTIPARQHPMTSSPLSNTVHFWKDQNHAHKLTITMLSMHAKSRTEGGSRTGPTPSAPRY
jgi:hypothetical protein